jgi:hypothetical protein
MAVEDEWSCIFIIYSLLNYIFSSSDCVASNGRMIVSNELERVQKEAVLA